MILIHHIQIISFLSEQDETHVTLLHHMLDTCHHMVDECIVYQKRNPIDAKQTIETIFLLGIDLNYKNQEHLTPFQITSSQKENELSKYRNQLLKREARVQRELSISEQKDSRTYLRLLKTLSSHEKPSLIQSSLLLILYCSMYGVVFEAKTLSEERNRKTFMNLPAEVVEMVLEHYLTALDSIIDSSYRPSDFTVQQLQNALRSHFFKVAAAKIARNSQEKMIAPKKF